MKYRSCPMINGVWLNFNGTITDEKECISFCCEPIEKMPKLKLGENGEQTIRSFLALRNELISRGMKKKPFDVYENCTHMVEKEWSVNDKIGYINLSCYPSPC